MSAVNVRSSVDREAQPHLKVEVSRVNKLLHVKSKCLQLKDTQNKRGQERRTYRLKIVEEVSTSISNALTDNDAIKT